MKAVWLGRNWMQQSGGVARGPGERTVTLGKAGLREKGRKSLACASTQQEELNRSLALCSGVTWGKAAQRPFPL